NVGVYHVYSSATGDALNGLDPVTNTTLYAHMSYLTDAVPGDLRLKKLTSGLPARQGPVTSAGPTSASSTIGFQVYPTSASPVPVIRNEELILLQAETYLALGNASAAIAAYNTTRVTSGGLAPSSLTASSPVASILTEILYEKRYSL